MALTFNPYSQKNPATKSSALPTLWGSTMFSQPNLVNRPSAPITKPTIPSYATPAPSSPKPLGPTMPPISSTSQVKPVTPTPTSNLQAQIAQVQAQIDAATKAGYSGNQQIQYGQGGQIIPNQTASYQAPVAPTVGNEQTSNFIPPATTSSTQTAPTAPSQWEAKVAAGLELSPEEIAAQEKLNALQSSYRMGLQDIEDKTIPMEFITGQQASLERRANLGQQTLQQQLALAQAKRQSSLDVSKFQLEREDKKTEAAKADKPIVADGIGYERQADGTYKSVFGTPKATKDEGVTLSPGEIRYEKQADGSYKQVASGGEKPLSAAAETKAIENAEKVVSAQQSASQSIGIVNNLLSGDRYKAISGAIQTGSVPFLGDRTAVTEYDQLKALLALGARSLLKGSGAVSDYESKVLNASTSSLSRLTNQGQMKEALQKVRGVLKTNQGQETEIVITNPSTGETLQTTATGKEIYDLVSEGNTITYL